MTREDFVDWLRAEHYCEIGPLPEQTTGNVIQMINPKNKNRVFIDLPIDDTIMKCFTVCQLCTRLLIPVPDECKDAIPLNKFINHKHSKK